MARIFMVWLVMSHVVRGAAFLANSILFLYVEWLYLRQSFLHILNPFLHLQVLLAVLTLPLFWVLLVVTGVALVVIAWMEGQANHLGAASVIAPPAVLVALAVAGMAIPASWYAVDVDVGQRGRTGSTDRFATFNDAEEATLASLLDTALTSRLDDTHIALYDATIFAYMRRTGEGYPKADADAVARYLAAGAAYHEAWVNVVDATLSAGEPAITREFGEAQDALLRFSPDTWELQFRADERSIKAAATGLPYEDAAGVATPAPTRSSLPVWRRFAADLRYNVRVYEQRARAE